jgi:hypothetical protein
VMSVFVFVFLPSFFTHIPSGNLPFPISQFSNVQEIFFRVLWRQATWRLHHQKNRYVHFAFPNPQWMWMSLWPFASSNLPIIQFHLTQSFSNNFPSKYSNKYYFFFHQPGAIWRIAPFHLRKSNQ